MAINETQWVYSLFHNMSSASNCVFFLQCYIFPTYFISRVLRWMPCKNSHCRIWSLVLCQVYTYQPTKQQPRPPRKIHWSTQDRTTLSGHSLPKLTIFFVMVVSVGTWIQMLHPLVQDQDPTYHCHVIPFIYVMSLPLPFNALTLKNYSNCTPTDDTGLHSRANLLQTKQAGLLYTHSIFLN